MSRATELAKAEADEAERETPDEPETPAEPEPEEREEAEEEEAAEPEPVTEAMLRKIGESISKEDSRHEKRLRGILGDLWEGREPCPLCLQEGFIIPAAPDEFDPMQRLAVLAAMGDGAEPTYQPHPQLERCQTCAGHGKLKTGSLNPGFDLESCFSCSGNGYIAKGQPAQSNVVPMTPPADAWQPPAPAVPTANADPWGRPWGHGDWGLDPSLVNATG